MKMYSGFCEDFSAKMQTKLDTMVRNGICTGASIAVGRFGKLAVRCNSGWADKENQVPICNQTLFQMHSLTKPVTAVAVMQLLDKGCICLEDPISKYIPSFENMQVCHTLADGTEELLPAKKSITIHDLLTMTSGIPYDGTGFIGAGIEQLSEGIVASRKTDQPWDTMTYVRHLSQVPLRFEPSQRYQYGLGFDVLGALVEACSGKRLDRYCQDHIFSPLGIESATFMITEAQKKKLAVSYKKGSLIREPLTGSTAINAYTLGNTSYTSGGSGLICTLDDYFKFAKMLANKGKTETGEVIISEDAWKLMSEPRLTETQLQSFAQEGDRCLHAAGYSYGYGVHVMKHPRNHLPVGEWGWAGTMGAWLSIDPKNDIFWVYVHQVTPSDYNSYIPDLSKLIYACLE